MDREAILTVTITLGAAGALALLGFWLRMRRRKNGGTDGPDG